jgi:hypothetical protein
MTTAGSGLTLSTRGSARVTYPGAGSSQRLDVSVALLAALIKCGAIGVVAGFVTGARANLTNDLRPLAGLLVFVGAAMVSGS